ncbi:ATPase subunit of ABC transporter with duplicated ATPase domains [Paraburkholderia sp. Clong3]|uniref:hypothetical protein n=1 Tax=Paraburkholderia sp. Clong3 TaxID=2991061 RepID=UPI003D210E73
MMTEPDPVIETRELVRRFGTLTAVDSVNLSVAAGEIVGLLGRNGAYDHEHKHEQTEKSYDPGCPRTPSRVRCKRRPQNTRGKSRKRRGTPLAFGRAARRRAASIHRNPV